ncbi:MAG: ligase-associated DNA damage response DEXH box helicase [Flavobacteriales bacterium]|nr:ligase-associated DNA damage response DEXH box helicase [Flavobacteriales bacterium]
MTKETRKIFLNWFEQKGWQPHEFQTKSWKAFENYQNGIVNAPTGMGKTYSLWFPILGEYIDDCGPDFKSRDSKGLQAMWITPLRALTREIMNTTSRVAKDLEVPFRVDIRTGDTSTSKKQTQKKNMPQLLITTPESLHILLSTKEYSNLFKNLKTVVVDEWHELIGSKRGVLIELALSRLKVLRPKLKTWGISATIGNLNEAANVLFGNHVKEWKLIKTNVEKKIKINSILPDTVEEYPYSGYLGIKLLEKVLPIIKKSKTTLIFTNTRSQSEIWYQRLLAVAPELAGQMAMHHGSIDKKLRLWVEEAIEKEMLQAVVCTSSLDLGVDFAPVETVIQIGGPKGIARFMQRAGRSGHRPGGISEIYFLPTHSLELLEAAALREAAQSGAVEARIPYIRSFDVLIQYLMTLAVSDGFKPNDLLPEILSTHCFASLDEEEWRWILHFLTTGGKSLYAYDEFKKVEVIDGLYKVTNRRTAMRHRMSIGTIVSDIMMNVKYKRGKRIGQVEEYFVSRMSPGDTFVFSGNYLELVEVKDMDVIVKPSKKKSGRIPAWGGGRMSMSSQLGHQLRAKLADAVKGKKEHIELEVIAPIFDKQRAVSHVPKEDELLIEYFQSEDGYHLCIYPFEGRNVHEALSSLYGYRISLIQPMSFSLAFTDYGFELLADQPIPVQEALDNDLFTLDHLTQDLMASINSTEMARRKFRDIASIAGLVFQGYPNKKKKERHLQASSSLFFDVFRDYEPDNLLYRQAIQEVYEHQIEETRLREALKRINKSKIVFVEPKQPTPFSFPIIADRLRERLVNEPLEERIKKMKLDRS